jgi:hypothetical protein
VIEERGRGEGFAGKENNPSLFISTCSIPGMVVFYQYVDSCHVSILKSYTICLN